MGCPRQIFGEFSRLLLLLSCCCKDNHKCHQAVHKLTEQAEKAREVFEKEMNLEECGMICNDK